MKIFMQWLLAGASLCAAARAESPGLRGPSTGYFFDEQSGAIRSLRGVPGAATFGARVLEGLSSAWIAPGGRAALAVNHDGLYLVRLAGALEVEALPDTVGTSPRVAWAPGGESAVLYSTGSRSFQRVRTQSGHVAVDSPEPLSLPDGEVAAVAVSASGTIAVALRSADSGGVYVVQPGAPAQRVAAMDDAAALAFAATGRLFAMDRASRSVYSLESTGEGWQVSLLAQENEGSLTSVAASPDGRRVFLAVQEPHRVVSLDTGTGARLAVLDLDIAPHELHALADGVFLMRSRSQEGGPLWVLDARHEAPAAFFVPSGESRE